METLERSRRLKRIHWFKMFSFLAILVASFAALLLIENLLVSFVIAIVISFFVSPLVSHLEGTGISRTLSILTVFTFFSVITGLIIWSITPFLLSQMASLKVSLPLYVDGTVKLFDHTIKTIDSYSGGLINFEISDRIRNWLTAQSTVLVEGLPSILSSSASVLFLSPLIGFFILKDGHQFSRELLKLVPNNIFELTLNLQHQIGQQIAFYIRARLFESIIVGLVCMLGFWIIGTPYAVLLAVFAGLANLIPYVGPLFGAAPGIIFALINQFSGLSLLLVIMVYIIAQLIDNFLLIPLVVARIVNLHPLTVILVVLLGAQLMGILGMLISIPVASTLKVTFRSIYDHLTDYSS